jgi:protein-tyrosine phosphatase
MFLNLTQIPFDLPGKVYRSPLPHGDFDLARTTLQELISAEVRVYYSLVEPIEWTSRAFLDVRDQIEATGIQRVEFPIRDFFAPEDGSAFVDLVAQAHRHALDGKNIAAHCYAGIGRTGMFLAELAVQHYGWDVPHAVEWLRASVPLAVENEYQYQFLVDLHSNH